MVIKNMNFLIKKNWLPLLSIFFTTTLTIIGIIANNNIQDKFQDLEILNRKQLNRPKLLIKNNPYASKISLIRDNGFINSEFDYDKNENVIDSLQIKRTKMLLNATYNFTVINNSEHITDIVGWVFTDTASSIQYPITDLFNRLLKKKNIENENVFEEHIQLDYQDTLFLSFPDHIIRFIEGNTFYLHLVLIYSNQFGDFYQSYFTVKGNFENLNLNISPLIQESLRISNKVTALKIEKIYLKDNNIKLESLRPYTKFLTNNESIIVKEFFELATDEYFRKKEEANKLLNK